MFVGQAALQFFVFTSLPPSSDVREAMRKALRREIGPTRD
jgi:shikimate 5-dehydrogenase